MKEILKYPVIIYYLVKKLKERNPEKQIGKTVLQKMMYLFEGRSNSDLGFTMYHYGPYSSEVEDYINLAEVLGLIKVDWKPEKGYFIEPNEPLNLPSEVTSSEKEMIDNLVNKYGDFSAIELSIIATAIYIKDNFGIGDNEIIDTVLSLKPNKREWVEGILKKAGFIDETN